MEERHIVSTRREGGVQHEILDDLNRRSPVVNTYTM